MPEAAQRGPPADPAPLSRGGCPWSPGSKHGPDRGPGNHRQDDLVPSVEISSSRAHAARLPYALPSMMSSAARSPVHVRRRCPTWATDAELLHPGGQRGPLHAQSRRRPVGAAQHPVGTAQRVQNVHAHRLVQRLRPRRPGHAAVADHGARLEALLTSQQLLFRNLSHELRSPLARVQVALGLLRQHTGTEAARYLERIDREVDRLNRLIGQMLTLARLESGVEVAQGEVCDLRALVQEVGADGHFEAQARQGAVTLVAAEACRVAGNTELLHSAIENVVRNAVRYTTAGTTTEVPMSGHATPAGPHAVIEVRDYGPGVPEAELAHLFQPFYRLTPARGPQPDGAGLGLAITARVVQLHGGTLAAANAPGGGLRVTIRLPMLPRDCVGGGRPA
jgi:signal transduction histidine kinase